MTSFMPQLTSGNNESDPPFDPAPPGGRRLPIVELVALARWREAEAAVYPLVMTDPGSYESALTAIGLTAAVLGSLCTRRSDLFDLADDDVARAVAADERVAHAVQVSGVSPRLLFDAARAQALMSVPLEADQPEPPHTRPMTSTTREFGE